MEGVEVDADLVVVVDVFARSDARDRWPTGARDAYAHVQVGGVLGDPHLGPGVVGAAGCGDVPVEVGQRLHTLPAGIVERAVHHDGGVEPHELEPGLGRGRARAREQSGEGEHAEHGSPRGMHA